MPKAAGKFHAGIGHRHFGKSDLEGIGLFAEMGNANGKGYVSPLISECMKL
jgi:hypothetical protein